MHPLSRASINLVVFLSLLWIRGGLAQAGEIAAVVEEGKGKEAMADVPGNYSNAVLCRVFRPPKLSRSCQAPTIGGSAATPEIRLVSYNVLADTYAKSVCGLSFFTFIFKSIKCIQLLRYLKS